MTSSPSSVVVIIAVLAAVLGSMALAAQDKYNFESAGRARVTAAAGKLHYLLPLIWF
jgi:hypothetical protein